MTNALAEEGSGDYLTASSLLGELADKARPAVPALIRAWKEGTHPTRELIARELKRIDPEAAAGAGVR